MRLIAMSTEQSLPKKSLSDTVSTLMSLGGLRRNPHEGVGIEKNIKKGEQR